MKKLFIYLLTITLTSPILQSCVMTTIKSEIEDTVNTAPGNLKIKSEELKYGYLTLQINNTAENTILQIDSLEICNIQVPDNETGLARKGNIMLDSTAAKLPVQTFRPWEPNTLPQHSSKMYIKIYGQMLTFLLDGTPLPLYTGPMYLSFNATITENTTTTISLNLYPGCPLYCQINGQMEKVLQPINFDATVNGWDTHEYPVNG